MRSSLYLPVILGMLFLMLTTQASSNEIEANPSICADQFAAMKTNPSYQNLKTYPGNSVSILEWISDLSSEEIINFLPKDYLITLNSSGIKSSNLKKLLVKFIDRINFEHGALFALIDSLKKVQKEIEILSEKVHSQPLLIKKFYESFILGKSKPPSLDISENNKKLYLSLIDIYQEVYLRKVFTPNQTMSEKDIYRNALDLRIINQALEKGTELNQALSYQASILFDQAKQNRTKQIDIIKNFKALAKNHFVTEEIFMTYFGNDLSHFNKHTSSHDLGLNELINQEKDAYSTVDLNTQSKKIKLLLSYFEHWLNIHIIGNDMNDYILKVESNDVESFFSIKNDRSMNSDSNEKRWKLNNQEFKSIDEYLLKVLNSDKLSF